jgi:multiple RNA-binding domain-containing protein 1
MSNGSQDQARTNRIVLVRGLSFNVSPAHIDEIFSTFGRVVNVDLSQICGHSGGSALVAFESQESATKAIEAMDGGNIDGEDLSVLPAEAGKSVEDYVDLSK